MNPSRKKRLFEILGATEGGRTSMRWGYVMNIRIDTVTP
jgi:hypothetical protein